MKLDLRLIAIAMMIAVATARPRLHAWCPFCSAVSQSLRQEMAAMDTVIVARFVSGSEADSRARFSVTSVIRGDKWIRAEQQVLINFFGKPKPDQLFLLMGVDPGNLLWSTPLPVSATAINYVKAINELPSEMLPRLEFYLDYLEHEDSLLARDAYNEFALAPYEDIKRLRSTLDREQLMEWIKDINVPVDRKRLYFVMLGVCGKPSDAELLEELMRSDDPNRKGGLDSMIACYVTLKGGEGLTLIDELFLAATDSHYADTYAAIMALRFHGTEGGIVEKDRVVQSMRLILDRPRLADLVIPDLARWEDWDQIDKMVSLFKSADEQTTWVRVPVINYLRACPHEEAKDRLEELKEIDPAAYTRATSFFPIPSSDDGSSTVDPDNASALAVHANGAERQPNLADSTASESDPLVQSVATKTLADTRAHSNRLQLASVIACASSSIGLAIWLFTRRWKPHVTDFRLGPGESGQ